MPNQGELGGRTYRERAHDLFWVRSTDRIEVMFAWYLMVFGIFLLLPFRTMESVPAFATLREVTLGGIPPEVLWGTLIAGVGANGYYSYYLSHTPSRRRRAVIGEMIIVGILWMSFFRAAPASTATVTYPIMFASLFMAQARLQVLEKAGST